MPEESKSDSVRGLRVAQPRGQAWTRPARRSERLAEQTLCTEALGD